MCSGRILKMSLCSDSNDKTVTTNVIVNGIGKGKITLPSDAQVKENNHHHSAVTDFNPSIELQEGDVVNFKSGNTVSSARSTIAALLIEMDC